MLGDLWSSILSFFASLFNWLYDHVIAGILYLFNIVWNWIVDRFWDLYTLFIQWICEAVAYFISTDDLDYDSTFESIFDQIAGLDQIFPVHESFLLLSFLFTYHLVRLALRYGTFIISMIRTMLPF